MFFKEKILVERPSFFFSSIKFPEFAKAMGMKKSKIRLSSKVFKIISKPIPLGSPTEIPTLIFEISLIPEVLYLFLKQM